MWFASFAKLLQLLGLLLAVGLPAFRLWVWQRPAPAPVPPEEPGWARRLFPLAVLGAVLILTALVLDLVRILYPFLPGLSPQESLALAGSFMRHTEVGRWFAVRPFALVGYLLVLNGALAHVRLGAPGGSGEPGEPGAAGAVGRTGGALPRPLQWAYGLAALFVLLSVSLTAHGAVSMGPAVGGAADVVHLASTMLWVGAAWGINFLSARDRAEYAAYVKTAERLSFIGLASVLAAAATGFALAAAHTFSPGVAAASMYGRTLAFKLALFGIMLLIAAGNRFQALPALRRALAAGEGAGAAGQAAAAFRRFQRRMRVEWAVLMAIVAITAVLTQVWPPTSPGRLLEAQQWERQVGPWTVRLSMAPEGQARTHVAVEVADGATGAPASPDRVRVVMDMETHVMGMMPPRLVETAPGRFEGSTHLLMPGRWQVDVFLSRHDVGTEKATFFVDAAEVPLIERAPFQIVLTSGWEGALRFATGLAIAAIGLWIFIAWVQHTPRSGAWGGIASGLAFFLGGVFWIVHLAVSPTTYMPSPVQAAESVASEARPLYEAHCAVCHGPTGRGDGPMASQLQPPPADFVVHVGHHREGEFFWFITHGVRGTAMPGFKGVLSDDERWLLTRYVRELGLAGRRPAPPPDGSGPTASSAPGPGVASPGGPGATAPGPSTAGPTATGPTRDGGDAP